MKPKDLITFLDKNDFNNIDPSNNFGGYVDEGYYVVYTELFVKFLKKKKYKICVSTLKDLLGKVLRFEKKTDFLKKLFKKKFPSFNLNKHYSFWKKKNIGVPKMLPPEKTTPSFHLDDNETYNSDDSGDSNPDLFTHS